MVFQPHFNGDVYDILANMESKITIEKVSVLSDALVHQFNTLRDDGTEWESQQGKKFLANADNALFLAFLNTQLVGFLTAHRLQRLDKRKAEVLIYEVAVLKDFRQQGIGKALIAKVVIWAREVKADEVWVLTNKANTAAVALYSSLGGIIESDDEQMFTFKIAKPQTSRTAKREST